MKAGGIVEKSLSTSKTFDRVYLVASGTEYLGTWPIVLVTVDEGEVFPIYVDTVKPWLYSLHVKLSPGEHTFQFHYHNDFEGRIGRKTCDRNLKLHRLVLTQEGPRAPGSG